MGAASELRWGGSRNGLSSQIRADQSRTAPKCIKHVAEFPSPIETIPPLAKALD